MPKRGTDDRLTPALLAAPAPHAVRVVALARLAQARAAYDRYVDGDPEGLHDFRVALRRLRSWLRAFRPQLEDTVRGKTRRRLKALANATNAARDSEVALLWIAQLEERPPRARAGMQAVVNVLERECEAAARDVRRSLARELPGAGKRLSADLEAYVQSLADDERGAGDARLHAMHEHTMASILADALSRQSARLTRALQRIESADDTANAHRARITAKQLRYLLEPLDPDPHVTSLLATLGDLQQSLGDMRDAHRLGARLVREIGERAARDARARALASLGYRPDDSGEQSFAALRPGIMHLARAARAAELEAFARFEKEFTPSSRADLARTVDDVAALMDH